MASKTISIGAYGKFEGVVDQVSQNLSANTSRVRVRGILQNPTGADAYNGDSVARSVSGTNSWSGGGGISVPANSSQTIIDIQFTVTHDSAGNKTVSYSIHVGDTGTYTFGDGGTVSVSLALTRIPKVPNACGTPTLAYTPPNTITLTKWTIPNNNGAALDSYQINYANNSAFTNAKTATTTSFNKALTDITPGQTWYVRIRAHNKMGYGPWSGTASVFAYAGPRVNVEGVWKYTLGYVNVEGTWKIAVPYVKSSGSWKLGAG